MHELSTDQNLANILLAVDSYSYSCMYVLQGCAINVSGNYDCGHLVIYAWQTDQTCSVTEVKSMSQSYQLASYAGYTHGHHSYSYSWLASYMLSLHMVSSVDYCSGLFLLTIVDIFLSQH